MKLLIATKNPAKKKEFKKLFKGLPIELVSLEDLKINKEIKEAGENFEENAILKARGYYRLSGMPTLAEDGGLEIDALGGWPGVYSRRVKDGLKGTDEELIQTILEKMKGIPQEKRGCQMRCVVALILDNSRIYMEEGISRGTISEKPSQKRIIGFPYRSIFYVPEFDKISVDAEDSEELMSHRKNAVEKIKKYLTF